MKLDNNKCQFRKESIVFLGYMIFLENIRVGFSEIETITKMLVPQSLTELQRFLRMVNYLDKFIPNLTKVTEPLWAILKNDVVFYLWKPQLAAIEKLKTLIPSAPIPRKFSIQIYHYN